MHKPIFCSLAICFCCFIPFLVQAAGTGGPRQVMSGLEEAVEPESLYFFMNQPVSIPSRFIQTETDAPGHVVVVTDSMIRKRGYRSLLEVLKDLPGFDIHERIGGQAGGAYVIQRGLLGNNKIQVFKNGIPLNPANGTHLIYGDHLSVDGLKRIEIFYGPGSAMYGADAFAGVINLVTKDVKPGLSVEGRVSAGNNDALEGYILAGGRKQDRFFQLYAHGLRTSDFDMSREYSGKTYQLTGYGQVPYYREDLIFDARAQSLDLMGRAGIGNLTLDAFYYHNRQPNNIQTPWHTGRTHDGQDKAISDTWIFNLKHRLALNDWMELLSSAGYQYYELDPTSNYGRDTFDNFIYERSKAVKIEEQLNCDYTSGKLVLGFSAKRVSTMPYLNSRDPFDGGDSFQGFPVERLLTADGRMVSVPELQKQVYWYYGGFAQITHEVTDRLVLTAGCRYDWETFNHDETFNPRASLVYRLGEGESLKLNYGKAYIFPSPYFRFKAWADESAQYVHLNPDIFGEKLSPERLESVELNWQKIQKDFSWSISLFWAQTRDMIQESGIEIPGNTFFLTDGRVVSNGTVELPANFGMQTNVGVELSSRIRIMPELNIDLQYSFINARIRMGDEEFDAPKVSNHKVAIGVSGTVLDRFQYSLTGRWHSDIHTQRTNSVYHGDKMAGAFLLDGNLRVLDIFPGADLEFKANNLLDRHYYGAGTASEDSVAGVSLPRIPQAPFQFYLGLSFRY